MSWMQLEERVTAIREMRMSSKTQRLLALGTVKEQQP
jgi:hypothetical protein